MIHVNISTGLDPTSRRNLSATVAENTFCLINTIVYAFAWYLRNWVEKYDYINNLTKTFLHFVWYSLLKFDGYSQL